MYNEDELLSISGLHHFAFCRRRWALIHIEQQWRDNYYTADGQIVHERAHNADARESRGDLLIERAMRVRSFDLGVTGECDVVEFRWGESGAVLAGRSGLWQPYPIEYKRGAPKQGSDAADADLMQLTCQAMCLEEMLCCEIPEGAMYYHETRRRLPVAFTGELRDQVRDALRQMHAYAARGYTPRARPQKACGACSLRELCVPALTRRKDVGTYLRAALEEAL